MARRLVVGFDGSPPARAALEWAERVARGNHGRLALVLVLNPPWFVGVWQVPSMMPELVKREQAAIEALRVAVAGLGDEVPVTWRVVRGHVGIALAREMLAHDCDAIVIGRGRRRWRPWPGSVARYLRCHVAVQVIVVPVDHSAGEKSRPLERCSGF